MYLNNQLSLFEIEKPKEYDSDEYHRNAEIEMAHIKNLYPYIYKDIMEYDKNTHTNITGTLKFFKYHMREIKKLDISDRDKACIKRRVINCDGVYFRDQDYLDLLEGVNSERAN